MSHHRKALIVITAALVLDAAFGVLFALSEHIPIWHGLYCGLANAVTVGGDIQPTRPLAYLVTAGEFLTVVPLFAATFSLFTSGLAATHVAKAEARLQVTAEARHQELIRQGERHHQQLATARASKRKLVLP